MRLYSWTFRTERYLKGDVSAFLELPKQGPHALLWTSQWKLNVFSLHCKCVSPSPIPISFAAKGKTNLMPTERLAIWIQTTMLAMLSCRSAFTTSISSPALPEHPQESNGISPMSRESPCPFAKDSLFALHWWTVKVKIHVFYQWQSTDPIKASVLPSWLPLALILGVSFEVPN